MDLLQIKMVVGTTLGLFLGAASVMPATAKPVSEVRESQPIAQATSNDQMENNSDVAPDSVTNDNLNNDINNNPINQDYNPNQMENNSDVTPREVNQDGSLNNPTNQDYTPNQMENNSDVAPREINRNVNDGGSLNNPTNRDYTPNQMENNSDVDGTRVNNQNNESNDINRTTPNNMNNMNNVEYNDRSMQQEYQGVVESYDGNYLQMRMNDGSMRTFQINSDDLGDNVNLSPGQNVVITTQSGATSQVNPTYPALW